MNAPAKIETPLAKLREPFPDHHISWLPKETRAQIDARKNNKDCIVWNCAQCGGAHHKNAVHLQYVGHAALTDRLLDTDLEWSWEPMGFDEQGLPALDQRGGLWIKLTVAGVTRPGYGSADGKQGGDAVKEMIGDALRNAAMRFGAALDLWHKGDLHLEEDSASGADQGHSEEGAVSPDGPTPTPATQPAKGWREPESQYSTPSKLSAACRNFERELEACGDSEMVYGLTSTDDWKEFVRIADKHAPHYLHGGEPAPPEFEGLIDKAARKVREFDSEQAQHMTDLARA